jgi:signal peptide peptidase SppA
VFVLNFFGDIQASQVQNLRQEVTAVVQHASPERGDSVVLILNTGGGTVTGYGLAAAQLQRIKAAGLKLTICVEQVAASGGYMMACIADRLVAAPFAVLGSIGVITDIPNVYDRLLKEGIEFQTITAGKFKRTLTPTKKVTPEDKKKTTEDVEAIFKLFRGFVGENRPQLVIDEVATGETWFGQDALARNLVDELMAPDDVLLQLRKEGAELFSVKYSPAPSSPVASLLSAASSEGLGGDIISGAPLKSGGALGWWAQRLLEFATGSPPGALAQNEYSSPDRVFRAEDRSSEALQVRGF